MRIKKRQDEFKGPILANPKDEFKGPILANSKDEFKGPILASSKDAFMIRPVTTVITDENGDEKTVTYTTTKQATMWDPSLPDGMVFGWASIGTEPMETTKAAAEPPEQQVFTDENGNPLPTVFVTKDQTIWQLPGTFFPKAPPTQIVITRTNRVSKTISKISIKGGQAIDVGTGGRPGGLLGPSTVTSTNSIGETVIYTTYAPAELVAVDNWDDWVVLQRAVVISGAVVIVMFFVTVLWVILTWRRQRLVVPKDLYEIDDNTTERDDLENSDEYSERGVLESVWERGKAKVDAWRESAGSSTAVGTGEIPHPSGMKDDSDGLQERLVVENPQSINERTPDNSSEGAAVKFENRKEQSLGNNGATTEEDTSHALNSGSEYSRQQQREGKQGEHSDATEDDIPEEANGSSSSQTHNADNIPQRIQSRPHGKKTYGTEADTETTESTRSSFNYTGSLVSRPQQGPRSPRTGRRQFLDPRDFRRR